ncbi:hypothetical protein QOZ80_2AG0121200 [Eleusine coracana subsp. coracana]|nr:hypothetical protein QOZ80_2AG0121200 [Eleusine coracana subsp. coracana]
MVPTHPPSGNAASRLLKRSRTPTSGGAATLYRSPPRAPAGDPVHRSESAASHSQALLNCRLPSSLTCFVNVKFLHYNIDTTVTSDSSVIVKFLKEVWPNEEFFLFGLDTEWLIIPRVDRVNNDPNKTAIIRIYVGIPDGDHRYRCLLLQVYHADKVPKELKDFLESPRCMFFGSKIGGDVHRLSIDHNISVARTSELQDAVRDHLKQTSTYGLGLKIVCQKMLGLTMAKHP